MVRWDSIEARLTIVFAALAVSRLIERATGWSIARFVKTLRHYQTIATPWMAVWYWPSSRLTGPPVRSGPQPSCWTTWASIGPASWPSGYGPVSAA